MHFGWYAFGWIGPGNPINLTIVPFHRSPSNNAPSDTSVRAHYVRILQVVYNEKDLICRLKD